MAVEPPEVETRRWPVFWRHYAAMVMAMMAGMMLLTPPWRALAPEVMDNGVADALIMALNMSIGMALLMWAQGHGWRLTLEMAAAMVGSFVVLLVPYGFGMLSDNGLMVGGHILMLPAMFVAMLLRFEHYTHAHQWRRPFRRSDNQLAV